MNILITGATGFIGSALLAQLVQRPSLSLRAATRRGDGKFAPAVTQTAIGDIDGDTAWDQALAGIDLVIHAAARAHVMDETDPDPLAACRRVNTAGTLNLARQAAAAGVRRFIFLSSIKVNGESTMPGRPFRAGDPPAPVDAYGIAKHEAEEGLRVLEAGTGLEVVIIRPPLVYGHGVKGNFARLMAAVARGRPLPLGAIDNRRSLVAIGNLVDMIGKCIDNERISGKTLLVSDGEDLSTPELVRRLARAMGHPSRLISLPPTLLAVGAALTGKRAAFQRLGGSLQVDISETRRLLEWTPPYTVDEGLARMFAEADIKC